MNDFKLPSLEETIIIETSRGQFKVQPKYFNAIEGWEIKRQLKFYLESDESEKGAALRKSFTLRVLSAAEIIDGDKIISLNDPDAINSNLENWINIRDVFDCVLMHNGIEPEMESEVDAQAAKIGAAMGNGFWTQCVSMMEPLIAQYVQMESDKLAKEG